MQLLEGKLKIDFLLGAGVWHISELGHYHLAGVSRQRLDLAGHSREVVIAVKATPQRFAPIGATRMETVA